MYQKYIYSITFLLFILSSCHPPNYYHEETLLEKCYSCNNGICKEDGNYIRYCECDSNQRIKMDNYDTTCIENICEKDSDCKNRAYHYDATADFYYSDLPICSTEGKCVKKCETNLDCDGETAICLPDGVCVNIDFAYGCYFPNNIEIELSYANIYNSVEILGKLSCSEFCTNGSCKEGFICNDDKHCVPSCESNKDCKEDKFTTDICNLEKGYCETECKIDLDCDGENEFCYNNQICLDIFKDYRYKKKRNIDYYNIYENNNLFAKCSSENPCKDNFICNNNQYCVPRCENNEDCKKDKFTTDICDFETNTCKPKCNDSDCEWNEVCYQGIACSKFDYQNEDCDVYKSCGNSYCDIKSNKCIPICIEDANCIEDDFIGDKCINNQCFNREECETNFDCKKEESCNDGLCLKINISETCWGERYKDLYKNSNDKCSNFCTKGSCQNGFVCNDNRYCVPNCNNNEDCKKDKFTTDICNLEKGYCETECITDLDCSGEYEICYQNYVCIDISKYIYHNKVASLYFDPYSRGYRNNITTKDNFKDGFTFYDGKEVPYCRNNEDCKKDKFTTDICNLETNTCEPKCKTNQDCPDDEICYEGIGCFDFTYLWKDCDELQFCNEGFICDQDSNKCVPHCKTAYPTCINDDFVGNLCENNQCIKYK